MIAAISSGFGSASGSLDEKLCFAGTNEVVNTTGQLFANLKVRVRLNTSSDGGASGSVQ